MVISQNFLLPAPPLAVSVPSDPDETKYLGPLSRLACDELVLAPTDEDEEEEDEDDPEEEDDLDEEEEEEDDEEDKHSKVA